MHRAAPTRGAIVVRELMEGHRPQVWCSDRYSDQQGHGAVHQTCLAHLARDVAYADQASDAGDPADNGETGYFRTSPRVCRVNGLAVVQGGLGTLDADTLRAQLPPYVIAAIAHVTAPFDAAGGAGG